MTIRTDIQSALRGVVDALGETWQYRRMTSGPATQTRTYGNWTDVTIHGTGRAWSQEYTEEGQSHDRREVQRIRVRDDATRLYPGDQVRDTASVVWDVDSQTSEGVGSLSYQVSRRLPMLAAPNRNGGV